MNFDSFLNRPEFSAWRTFLNERIQERTNPKRHGDLPKWLNTLSQLPDITTSQIDFNQPAIQIGSPEDCTEEQLDSLNNCLQGFIPWRKGPYNFFGIHVDTEWRSDWKWNRLISHIKPLKKRSVLDVGCGNGYHCWRMLGAGAAYVLGIDPSMRFLTQYLAAQKYVNSSQFDFLPIGIEDMPTNMPAFDSVFSMGVLYHRRRPENHLKELSSLLKADGELILETLIVDEAPDGLLRPDGRYAKMRNVWSIMTTDHIVQLLEQEGFKNSRCVDINTTSLQEQRVTDWMQFQSLADFLDPDDISKTVEGYPAPKRAIFVAQK